jgi:hypothetical protein
MTEDEARAICVELGATYTVRTRRGQRYIYVSRWAPRTADQPGRQHDCYVGPLAQLAQISADTLRQRIATLPIPPRPHPHGVTPPPAAAPPTPPLGTAFVALLGTIPHTRTGILTWAAQAEHQLSIPREQISYRLAFYRAALTTHGMRLAQSTRYRALFVPDLGTDSGSYYSHIWRDPPPTPAPVTPAPAATAPPPPRKRAKRLWSTPAAMYHVHEMTDGRATSFSQEPQSHIHLAYYSDGSTRFMGDTVLRVEATNRPEIVVLVTYLRGQGLVRTAISAQDYQQHQQAVRAAQRGND